jgi:hypothetical protein
MKWTKIPSQIDSIFWRYRWISHCAQEFFACIFEFMDSRRGNTSHVIANAQKLGGVAAFIDAEHALDTTWARKLGVDINSMLISQPDTGEQGLDIAEMLVKSTR